MWSTMGSLLSSVSDIHTGKETKLCTVFLLESSFLLNLPPPPSLVFLSWISKKLLLSKGSLGKGLFKKSTFDSFLLLDLLWLKKLLWEFTGSDTDCLSFGFDRSSWAWNVRRRTLSSESKWSLPWVGRCCRIVVPDLSCCWLWTGHVSHLGPWSLVVTLPGHSFFMLSVLTLVLK